MLACIHARTHTHLIYIHTNTSFTTPNLQVAGAIWSALVFPPAVYTQLATARFILGVGAGGVYPLAAAVASNAAATTATGGRSSDSTVALVFSLQGVAFVSMNLLATVFAYTMVRESLLLFHSVCVCVRASLAQPPILPSNTSTKSTPHPHTNTTHSTQITLRIRAHKPSSASFSGSAPFLAFLSSSSRGSAAAAAAATPPHKAQEPAAARRAPAGRGRRRGRCSGTWVRGCVVILLGAWT